MLEIENPPYQLADGGQGASASAIYHHFILDSIHNSPNQLVAIIPARWMVNAKGKGVKEFREDIINGNLADKDGNPYKVVQITDYADSSKIFPTVDIKGGVCILDIQPGEQGDVEYVNGLTGESKVYNLNTYGDIIIRDFRRHDILDKVISKSNMLMIDTVSSSKQFGMRSNFSDWSDEGVKVYCNKFEERYTHPNNIKDKEGVLDMWKVIAAKSADGIENAVSLVLGRPKVIKPGECCTETYLTINSFDTEEEAVNFEKYFKTKFFRFMVNVVKVSQNVVKKVYRFVPDFQDYTEDKFTDEWLYEHFELTDDEIELIESEVRSM